MVEHLPFKQVVVGSIPTRPTIRLTCTSPSANRRFAHASHSPVDNLSTGFVRCISLPQARVRSSLELPIGLDDNSLVIRETSPVILVVEDDNAVRQPLIKFLQMRQYTVVAAETAEEGVAAAQSQSQPPAAAIIDLHLRGGSGREVVAALPATTPVIIFSGQRAECSDFEGRPFTRIVEKPYSLIMLMDTLQDMLEPGRGGGSFGHAAAS